MNETDKTDIAIFAAASIAFVGFVAYVTMAEKRIKDLEKTVRRKNAVIKANERLFDIATKHVPTSEVPALLQDMMEESKFQKIVFNNEM